VAMLFSSLLPLGTVKIEVRWEIHKKKEKEKKRERERQKYTKRDRKRQKEGDRKK
jgi:hypothetical protein